MTNEVMPVTVPTETVTPLKPSEAIRMGCLIEPRQAFGDDIERETGAVCAYGAMRLGFGTPVRTAWIADKQQFLYRFDAGDDPHSFRVYEMALDRDTTSTCPVGACEGVHMGTLSEVVVHLNDDHRWSRERIADYLAKVGY